MEVVEEINCIRDDRLDFLETFEEHREASLHVLKNTSAITATVLGEDYLRRIVETYFGLIDNITSMVDSMDVLEANLCERIITNEKGLINKSFKIYPFKFSFR